MTLSSESDSFELGSSRRVHLLMDLASTCDLRCIHCFRSVLLPRGARMSLEEIHTLEREVFPFVKSLALSCTGEPLTRSTFGEGLLAAKRAGIPWVQIQSNGTHLTEEMSRFLIESGLDHLGLSIDAVSRETFETIRRGANWNEVIENIRRFSALRRGMGCDKPALALCFTLTTLNADEARAFIPFALELGADMVSFSHLLLESWEARQWSLLDTPGRLNALLAELREEAEQWDTTVFVPEEIPESFERFEGPMIPGTPVHHGRCWAAEEDGAFLMPSGDLFPCGNLQDQGPLGNVFKTPFREIWMGERNQRFRRDALKGTVHGCDSCKIFAKTADYSKEMTFLAKRLTCRSAELADFVTLHTKRREFHRPKYAGSPR